MVKESYLSLPCHSISSL